MQDDLNPVINRYLTGQMSPAERLAFEARLATEPGLAAEVTFYETLHHQHDRNRRERWQVLGQQLLSGTDAAADTRPALTLQVTSRNRFYRLAVAATLALALGAVGFWFYQRASLPLGEKLYAREAKVLEDPTTLGANGEQDAWTQAYQLYRNERYAEARAEVTPLLAQATYQDRARLLLGFCWLQENQPAQAREALSKVSPKATAYYWQAQFGVALAYLRENDLQRASPVLQNIVAQSDAPALKERAAALVAELAGAQR